MVGDAQRIRHPLQCEAILIQQLFGSVGAPLVNTTISVFDPDDETEKQYGEEGELCISSFTIMMGYFKDEEMTKK